MASEISIWIIDDDRIYRYASQRYILDVDPGIDILQYAECENALDELKEMGENNRMPSAILLDVNMPVMDGWDFLEEYQKMSEEMRSQIQLYIVSSSIDEADKKRADENPDVTRYITKPVLKVDFANLVQQIKENT